MCRYGLQTELLNLHLFFFLSAFLEKLDRLRQDEHCESLNPEHCHKAQQKNCFCASVIILTGKRSAQARKTKVPGGTKGLFSQRGSLFSLERV